MTDTDTIALEGKVKLMEKMLNRVEGNLQPSSCNLTLAQLAAGVMLGVSYSLPGFLQSPGMLTPLSIVVGLENIMKEDDLEPIIDRINDDIRRMRKDILPDLLVRSQCEGCRGSGIFLAHNFIDDASFRVEKCNLCDTFDSDYEALQHLCSTLYGDTDKGVPEDDEEGDIAL